MIPEFFRPLRGVGVAPQAKQIFIALAMTLPLFFAGCAGLKTSMSSNGDPAISASANPATISAGQSSTLSWTTQNVASVSVDNGIGNVAINGTVTVSPLQTTTYHFTATSKSKTTSAAVMVSVAGATPSPTATAIPTPTVSNSGSANISTWHGDNGRSGLNDQETQLTPANVNSTTFGKLFSYFVDGYLYAQPLSVSNLNVNGGTHNVVFVATEADSVYAFDAENYGNGSPLWKTSLLQAGETPQSSGMIKPAQGVTSTPVIDLNSDTMYVVSVQKGSGNPFFRLHALDISTGQERSGSPVVVNASVPGTNSDSVNGTLSLSPGCIQRTALLLVNNTVIFGFSACHAGWLLAYDAGSLAQVGVFNTSPDTNGYGTYGGAGGIWMGGGGPVADDLGNVYITTGNGPFDGSKAWGDSTIRLNTQLQIQDYFAPSDFAALQCEDKDLSAGGALLIPGQNQLLVGGKSGRLILLNTGNMGHENANDAGAAQTLWFNNTEFTDNCTDNNGNTLSNTVGNYAMYSTAAWFNGSVYLGVTPGPVQRFGYVSGQLSITGNDTPDQIVGGSYGTTPFLSANGNANGIMWMLDHGDPIQAPGNVGPSNAVLRAYDAGDLSHKLYDSSGNGADIPGFGIKFTSPIVANGRVFIGTAHDPVTASNPQGELDVYGLK